MMNQSLLPSEASQSVESVLPQDRSEAAKYRVMSRLDGLLTELSHAAAVLHSQAYGARTSPARCIPEASLNDREVKHVAGLMRVNHVGEICAQALYRGQAFGTQDEALQRLLHQAGYEEVDHLVWCQERLTELNSRPSIFNPLWYVGSFGLGLLAASAGKKISLGFVAETERQVEQHLDAHLSVLPEQDERSKAIVTQMRDDEIEHREMAERQGGIPLPAPVRLAMRMMAKVMTTTAYRL